jgi:hypothetical protein
MPVDISAFGVGAKRPQKTICFEVKFLRTKVVVMCADVPKGDQRHVTYLSCSKDVFARQPPPPGAWQLGAVQATSGLRWRPSAPSEFL